VCIQIDISKKKGGIKVKYLKVFFIYSNQIRVPTRTYEWENWLITSQARDKESKSTEREQNEERKISGIQSSVQDGRRR
jgi:hypothetical protein